jgi:hypothetical protein
MDRFTVAVTAGVLALIAVALGASVLLRNSTTSPDLTTPGGTVLAYALAERGGDAQTAWSLLTPAAQRRFDREWFLARASDNADDRDYLTTEDERIDADGASVVLVRTYPASGGLFGQSSYSTRTTVRLVRADTQDQWRIGVPPDAASLKSAHAEDSQP